MDKATNTSFKYAAPKNEKTDAGKVLVNTPIPLEIRRKAYEDAQRAKAEAALAAQKEAEKEEVKEVVNEDGKSSSFDLIKDTLMNRIKEKQIDTKSYVERKSEKIKPKGPVL